MINRRIFSAAVLLAASVVEAQPKPRWRLVPDLLIDGTANELTQIGMVTVSPTGDIFVAQSSENLIRVFGVDGKAKRIVGRAGAGPGEFRRLSTIGFIGDTLYAADSELRRITLFSQSGRVLRTVPQEPLVTKTLKGDTMLARFTSLSVQALVDSKTAIAFPVVNSEDVGSGRFQSLPLYLMTASGTPLQRLAMIGRTRSTMQIKSKSGRTMYTNQPFADDPIFVVDPSGRRLAVIESNARLRKLAITDVNVEGKQTHIRSIPYSPVPIPSRVVDSVVANLKSLMAVSKFEADPRPSLYVPGAYPGVTRARMERDGTLWLRVSRPDESVHRWQIIAPDGTVKATVSVPENIEILSVDRGVWAAVRDPDDVQSMMRLQLRKR